ETLPSIPGEIRENDLELEWQRWCAGDLNGDRFVRLAAAGRGGAALARADSRDADGEPGGNRHQEHPATQRLDVRALWRLLADLSAQFAREASGDPWIVLGSGRAFHLISSRHGTDRRPVRSDRLSAAQVGWAQHHGLGGGGD